VIPLDRDPQYPKAYFDPRTAGTIAFCASFLGALVADLAFGAAMVVGMSVAVFVYGWVRIASRL
jgi:hypothetical protein